MVVDCHVHVSAFCLPNGSMSQRILRSGAFRFIRWRLGVKGEDQAAERQIAASLIAHIERTEQLDAAVVLAFDAVYGRDGQRDEGRTHLYVSNDYVIDLAKRNRKVLFGPSVHPYRKDAVAEIERCIAAGAVLLKWLPIVQDFDPSDERCIPVYEALAHYKLPLLSHTGGEKSLPTLNPHVADPLLLVPALRRGVTVIAAHCGTRSSRNETDFLPHFCQLAREYENCYGDTAALNLPTRSYAYPTLLSDPHLRAKLVHGSDWPIPAIPPISQLHIADALSMLREKNWMRRDVLIKQRLGLGPDYWHRAATLLRLPRSPFSSLKQRVPENAPGDFYVEAGSCLRCCLPHAQAPELMNDCEIEFRECYFRRQPQTPLEVEHAIQAIWVSELSCIRYGGSDQAIIRRLHELGRADSCDQPLIGEPVARAPWWRRPYGRRK